MSFYIRPKFKVGQKIFSIKEDKIVEIEIESIVANGNSICYLSKNNMFSENQSFFSSEEAKDFLENSIRLPFVKGDVCWVGNLTGVYSEKVKEVFCFFSNDLKKPYNVTTNTGDVVNNTNCFENQIEATEESLKQIKQYYKLTEK